MLPSAAEQTRPTPTIRSEITRPSTTVPPRPAGRALGPSAYLPGTLLGLLAAILLLAPSRTNVLILGSDRRPGEASAARSDTLILTTFVPRRPYVGMLSIPRDLWVEIPGYGPNRINAASFLAEADRPGSGPAAAVETVRTNFGVDVDNFVWIDFSAFVRFIDALGGLTVDLPTPMSGYPAGPVRLDGTQALAFVRDRKGSDDFFRMERGQILVRALLRAAANPIAWPRWPVAALMLIASVETDLPPWAWPSLALTGLRAGSTGIDGRVIGREMVSGFTTTAGAQVLAPDWSRINPVLLEMFGQ